MKNSALSAIHPIKYCSFYHNNLCHVCKQPSEALKRCGSCKTLSYCSKEHQKEDWKVHKNLCKVISNAEKDFLNFEVKTYEDFQTLRYMRCTAWQNKLNRPLENFENQMWMFPKVCVVCYSKDVKIDCRKCLNVSYCSEEHQNEFVDTHKKYCDALKLNVELDIYNMKEGSKPHSVSVCDISHKIKVLPKNLNELMRLFSSDRSGKSKMEKIQYLIKCDFACPSANILYGLEKSGLLKDRVFTKRSLTIHVVGADVVEVTWQWTIVLELIFHWIKNLRLLHFILIGPEVGVNWKADQLEDSFCQSCKSRNARAICTFSQHLYHEISQDLDSPDIIAAFNSGIHAYSDNIWTDSLNLLTKREGVPLVLTAYTLSELKSDVDIVVKNTKNNVRVIMEPQRNPFSSLRPMRDFNTFDVPIFYINGYIAVLMGVGEFK